MKYFNVLDIFGEGICFTIMGEKTVKNPIGSTFSLIMIALCILSILAFGKDFFDKTNPILTFTTVLPEKYEEPYAIDLKKVQFPFRIKNAGSSDTYNVSGMMEPVVMAYKFHNVNGSLKITDSKFIEVSICTEDLLPPELIKKIQDPSKYFCPDFRKTNTTIGGGLDGDYYHFFTLFWRCTKNKITSPTTPEVCDYDALEKFISQTQTKKTYAFHEIYYPEYYVNQDYNQPMKTIYKVSEKQINLLTQFLEKFSMQRVIFLDDQGWLTSNNVESDTLSFSSYNVAINNVNRDMVLNDKWSIHIVQILMEKKSFQYKRRFMKIQDLIAQVGGILNGIHKLFFTIHLIFFRYITKEYIMNHIFSFVNQDSIYENSLNKVAHLEISAKLNINQSSCNVLSELVVQRLNLKDKNVIPLKNKKNLHFGFFVGLKETFCCKNKVKDIRRDSYKKMNDYIEKRIDVLFYLDHLKQFTLLKALLLNPAQSKCLNYTNKPEIFNNEELEIFNIELEQEELSNTEKIVNYFREKVNNNHLSDIDSKLFYCLDSEIKTKI